MKKIISIITMVWLLQVVSLLSAIPDEPKVYLLQKTAIPPQIDGRLDDACWKNAPLITGFAIITEESKLAQEQTKAHLLFDNDNLYIGVELLESQIKWLKAVHKERDGDIFKDDCLEVFINTNPDKKDYCQLVVNSSGTQSDMNSEKGMAWDGDWSVKTSVGEKSWIVEMAIPFTTLGVNPQNGDLWMFNLCREHYAGNRIELSAWSNIGKNFHTPERFGYLVFGSFKQQLEMSISTPQLMKERKEIEKLLGSLSSPAEFEERLKKIYQGFEQIKKSLSTEEALTAEKWANYYRELKGLSAQQSKLKEELEFAALMRD